MWDPPRSSGSTALHGAAQRWWQALPSGPHGLWQLPVPATVASFAGNVLLISPDWLIEDGLLRPSDPEPRPGLATAVDYEAVIPFKHRVLTDRMGQLLLGGASRPARALWGSGRPGTDGSTTPCFGH